MVRSTRKGTRTKKKQSTRKREAADRQREREIQEAAAMLHAGRSVRYAAENLGLRVPTVRRRHQKLLSGKEPGQSGRPRRFSDGGREMIRAWASSPENKRKTFEQLHKALNELLKRTPDTTHDSPKNIQIAQPVNAHNESPENVRIKQLGNVLNESPGELQIGKSTLYEILSERPSWVPLQLKFDASSRKHTKAMLLRLIHSARKQIDVCVYIFTSKEASEKITDALFSTNVIAFILTDVCSQLCDELTLLVEQGVRVRVITDTESAGRPSSKISELVAADVEVHLGSTSVTHDKFMVIDKICRVNGSMNWSKAELDGNLAYLEIHYRHESVESAILHKNYANAFTDMWKRSIAQEPRAITEEI